MVLSKKKHMVLGIITSSLILTSLVGVKHLVDDSQVYDTYAPMTVQATEIDEPVDHEKLLSHVNYRNQEDFLSILGGYSDEAMQHGIFPSVMMAQAILESGADGSSLLALESKNLFGLKWHNQGQASTWTTLEDAGNQEFYEIQDDFRHYDSYHESIMDYLAKLSQEERYQYVSFAETPQKQAQLIQDAGYATDSQYADKLIRVMDTYNLYQYN